MHALLHASRDIGAVAYAAEIMNLGVFDGLERTPTPNNALERTRGSDRGLAMNFGARAAQRER